MTPQAVLSQPLTLRCGVPIKNRLFKSAMSEALGNRERAPTPELVRLYGAWADGGIGLCITGNVMIDRRALGEPGNVVIEDDRHMAELKAWAQAATRNHTQCWVQLNHPGKQSPKGLNKETVSPSAVPFRPEMQLLFATPRELTDAEIRDLIARYARAAGLVKQAGFTGVQIHGAHGYLVSQFLSPHHNRRTDEWGGSPEKRRRFVLEVYRAMRAAVGSDFPIGIKLNSADFQRGGFSEEESLDVIRALEAEGIDLVEISGGTYEAPAMTGVKQQPVKDSTRQREAYFLAFAEKARQAVKVPLVVTGGFRSIEGMAAAIESGAVDCVGLARALALETDLPNRLLAGQQPRYQVRPIKTGIRAIDNKGILEITWYTGQLKRIGRGEAPKPDESGLWVFIKMVGAQMGVGRKKKVTRVRAT
ncbi:MAG TPA: NADH:flavin oxidoreductase/NADH oxidase family protein [Aquabacterium sp.]|uniref:NADH:flavin oxidoreductase/NADH oxidase family protein n=1 Tax=Aquabacterium sp. TaxID=1872578 RepID=UPI002E310EDE|nr:NADH:flavin oxidoreductase/NADH oxidase family protein [Aquabacterium sp.]HEX5372541.1 NADH:flavin oxidoreductase/NADH oxidase family protein [Aquabacterium sp.]